MATKVGMSHMYTAGGIAPVTLLKVMDSSVLRIKNKESDGYNAIVVQYGSTKEKHIAKPQIEAAKKLNVVAKRHIFEVRLPDDFDPTVSDLVGSDFNAGIYDSILNSLVDIRGEIKGRGFSGTIKRWNFRRQPTSHGNSRSHRVPGSTGQRQDPGRVFKGKKMAGRYGGDVIMAKNLEVLYLDKGNAIIAVKGCVPGANNSVLQVLSPKNKFSDSVNNVKLK